MQPAKGGTSACTGAAIRSWKNRCVIRHGPVTPVVTPSYRHNAKAYYPQSSAEGVMNSSKPRCFVVMPFGKAGLKKRMKYDKVYEHIIRRPIEEAGYKCVRGDEIPDYGPIPQAIKPRAHQGDLVVADLSGRNPNVFYELGYRHASWGFPSSRSLMIWTVFPLMLRHTAPSNPASLTLSSPISVRMPYEAMPKTFAHKSKLRHKKR